MDEFTTPEGGAIRLSPEEAAKFGVQGFDLDAHLASIQSDAAVAAPLSVQRPEYYEIFGYKTQAATQCTGCTVAAVVQCRSWIQDPSNHQMLSGPFAYFRNRGNTATTQDAGASIGYSMEAAKRGICKEPLWPDVIMLNNYYVEPNAFTPPSAAADADALKQLALEVVYVGEGYEVGMIDKVKALLAAGYPLSVGIGNHNVALIEFDEMRAQGPNSHGAQPGNFGGGRVNIGWDIFPGVWNIYALMSVKIATDVQPPGTDNAHVIAALQSGIATCQSTLNTWTALMVTQTQIDATKAQAQAFLNQVNLLVADVAPPAPVGDSPDRTLCPPATEIVLMGKHWTLGEGNQPGGSRILRDGTQMGGGSGVLLTNVMGTIYTKNILSDWYKWSDAMGWTGTGKGAP